METKIFPGSLYLLIFQFLAAALSVGGGGRAKFNAAGEGAAGRARPAVLRGPEAAGPRGSPGASVSSPLRGRPEDGRVPLIATRSGREADPEAESKPRARAPDPGFPGGGEGRGGDSGGGCREGHPATSCLR